MFPAITPQPDSQPNDPPEKHEPDRPSQPEQTPVPSIAPGYYPQHDAPVAPVVEPARDDPPPHLPDQDKGIAINLKNRHPVGHKMEVSSPDKKTYSVTDLQLPHERDQSVDATDDKPDPLMVQAKLDLDAGQVDTDMRAVAGQNASLRAKLVPGPAGTPPASKG